MMGGSSAEREVSLKSGAAVLAALRAKGVDAQAFDPRDQPLENLRALQISRVFIAMHGRGGEDGSLQGALNLMGMPYTGSGVLASALAMDKWRCKLVWAAAGLPVPDYEIVTPGSSLAEIEARLGLPLFVKPASEGSSIGISKVKTPGGLAAAYALAAEYDDCVIAERFLAGGEFTVGIIGGQALPLIRIEPQTEFYDFAAKYSRDDTKYHIPSGLGAVREAEIQAMAVRAFHTLGGRGWGRVDVMLDASGRAWCLEANTSPGMTDHSLVPMAARAAGMAFDDLAAGLLEEARCD
jgi:D-alanine-D-alanine ligase